MIRTRPDMILKISEYVTKSIDFDVSCVKVSLTMDKNVLQWWWWRSKCATWDFDGEAWQLDEKALCQNLMKNLWWQALLVKRHELTSTTWSVRLVVRVVVTIQQNQKSHYVHIITHWWLSSCSVFCPGESNCTLAWVVACRIARGEYMSIFKQTCGSCTYLDKVSIKIQCHRSVTVNN